MADEAQTLPNGTSTDQSVPISERAVRRQKLSLVLEIEKKAQIANAVCWLMMVFAVFQLDDPNAFAIPLLSRFIASPLTHFSFKRARATLAAGGTGSEAIRPVAVALVVGGASWASMLPPLFDVSLNQPAALLIFGALVAGITIIVSMLAPVPILALTFAVGFQVTATALLFLDPPDSHDWGSLMAIDALFLVFLAYAFAATNRQEETARTLVTNRMLTQRLEASLREVEQLAYRDHLTGLMNRRSFFRFAEKLDPDRTRHVLTIDLDHFKAINDTFGHATGDLVLERVGAALRDVVSGLDGDDHCAARTGGEEFVMILDIDDMERTASVAEQIRFAIAGLSAGMAHAELKTSASIGVGEWAARDDLDEVLARADRATYRAKAAGRNRVERAAA
jgi:diguanylate cyclase (GGDEF)-like protein